MSVDREYRIRIQTVAESGPIKDTAKEIDNLGEKTGEAGKSAEHAYGVHHALHMVFSQLGQSSKEAQIGAAALAGVMLGSLTFGAMAVVQGVKMILDHFAKLKEKSLEVAKATVKMWEDMIDANEDALDVLDQYNKTLGKIITNTETLKQKEGEESAVLKTVLEQRLKILDAEREAEIAKAHGDKQEEARINARYGRTKVQVELDNEALEIGKKERDLDEQAQEVAKRQGAADAAAAAQAAGAPGRQEATAAAARLPKLEEELSKLQAARVRPEQLAALRQEANRFAGEADSVLVPGAGYQESFAGTVRRKLKEAEQAEEAYFAAQQEFEQARADVKRYRDGTKKLADAVEAATAALGKTVEEARGTAAEIEKAKAVHKVNVDAPQTIQGVKDRGEIEAAGGKYNAASLKVLEEVRAMAGTAEGQRMSGADTAYFNNLIMAARGSHKEDLAKAVIAELKDMHTDESKKWADLFKAIQDIRQVQGAQNKQMKNLSSGFL